MLPAIAVAAALLLGNCACIRFWVRRARRIVEDAERDAQRIKESARRTAAVAEAQKQARNNRSDRLPPGVYALVNEPFIGCKGVYVDEWTPLEDFACRKLDADGERRIVGFLVGDCRHKIGRERCSRIERVRELHLMGCRLRHHPEEPATPRGDAHAGDGDRVAAEVRDEDGHLTGLARSVVDGPVAHEDARAPGKAVPPEVPEAEAETADGGQRNAPVTEKRPDCGDDCMEVHAPSVAPAPDGRKDAGGNAGAQDWRGNAPWATAGADTVRPYEEREEERHG